MARSLLARLDQVEQQVLTHLVTEALTRARRAPTGDFAAVLMRWLPGNRETFTVDWGLMSDAELRLLAAWEGEP